MREDKDYIAGIRRGRDIERQTNRSSIALASVLGFVFGLLFGIIVGIVGSVVV